MAGGDAERAQEKNFTIPRFSRNFGVTFFVGSVTMKQVFLRVLEELAEADAGSEPLTVDGTTKPVWWWSMTRAGRFRLRGKQPGGVPDLLRLVGSLPESLVTLRRLVSTRSPAFRPESAPRRSPLKDYHADGIQKHGGLNELPDGPHAVYRDSRGRIVDIWKL